MTPEERVLVDYRLKRAREAIEEAGLLFDAGHLHTYVNRLYYACFYAMSALLLTRGSSATKHAHVRSVLHKDFVRLGTIPLEYGQFFDLLFNNRQERGLFRPRRFPGRAGGGMASPSPRIRRVCLWTDCQVSRGK